MDAVGTVVAVLLLLSPLALIAALVLWRKATKRARVAEEQLGETRERFAGIVDLDDEKAKVNAELAAARTATTDLQTSYAEKRATYDRLTHEIAIFDERLSFAEMGVYEPHFDFSDSEAYKSVIIKVRDNQKRMVSDKTAVYCTTTWSVDGSASKGKSMTNRNIRLTLRAFNNECDAAVANTRWNNVNAMEKRVLRAKEQIEKLNASNAIFVSSEFLKLKLEELYLTHEYVRS